MEHINTLLILIFIVGQVLNTGNMIWQQSEGYYEINPIYGAYPSVRRIYMTKIIETIGIFGLFAFIAIPYFVIAFIMLVIANLICWGFITYDRLKGIPFKMEWR